MPSKIPLLMLGLLVGATSLPSSLAAANGPGAAGGPAGRVATTVPPGPDKAAYEKRRKAAAVKKKRQQQAAAAKAKTAQARGAGQRQQEAKGPEWYARDRDRGLDAAAHYAPKTIARIRARNVIAKGDTIRTGGGKTGWRHYMDRYYSR